MCYGCEHVYCETLKCEMLRPLILFESNESKAIIVNITLCDKVKIGDGSLKLKVETRLMHSRDRDNHCDVLHVTDTVHLPLTQRERMLMIRQRNLAILFTLLLSESRASPSPLEFLSVDEGGYDFQTTLQDLAVSTSRLFNPVTVVNGIANFLGQTIFKDWSTDVQSDQIESESLSINQDGILCAFT